MALLANAMTTLANVKAQLQIPSDDTSQDTFLELLINNYSSSIESYCNRKFTRSAYIENLPYSNSQIMQMAQWPIQVVTYVKNNGATLVAGTDYQVYSQFISSGQIYRGQTWYGNYYVRGLTGDFYANEIALEFSYTAGYYMPNDVTTPPADPHYVAGAANSLPLDIQNCIQMMIGEAYNQSIQGNLGGNLQSLSEGGLSFSWGSQSSHSNALFEINNGMKSMYAMTLNKYRKWVVA